MTTPLSLSLEKEDEQFVRSGMALTACHGSPLIPIKGAHEGSVFTSPVFRAFIARLFAAHPPQVPSVLYQGV